MCFNHTFDLVKIYSTFEGAHIIYINLFLILERLSMNHETLSQVAESPMRTLQKVSIAIASEVWTVIKFVIVSYALLILWAVFLI